jgi:hypothetical protein
MNLPKLLLMNINLNKKFQLIQIVFTHQNQKVVIPVEEGSLYVMTDDARYKWKHQLQNNTTNTRYSITYRTINKNIL